MIATLVWSALAAVSLFLFAFLRRSYFLAPTAAFTVAAICSAFRIDLLLQLAAFALTLALVSALFLFITGKTAAGTVSLDEIIGAVGTVVERVDSRAGCGEVKVKGTVWSARSAVDDEIYECGETVSVVAIEGVKLICKK